MKIKDEKKKILMRFCRFLISNKKELGSNSVNRWIVDDFINSLTLGKPEPLEKNKQTQEFKKCDECIYHWCKRNNTCFEKDCLGGEF